MNYLGSRSVVFAEVPVDAVGQSETVAVGGEMPRVSVRVRVPRSVVLDKDPSKIVRLYVDVGGLGLGEKELPVMASVLRQRVELADITPAAITVKIDPVAERDMFVRVVPSGNPAAGYRLGELKAEPEKVRVKAALGFFEKNAGGLEAAVDIEGAETSVTADTRVGANGALSVTPQTVRVTAMVDPAAESKNVAIKAKITGETSAGYFIKGVSVVPANAAVSAVRERLAGLGSLETEEISVAGASMDIERDVKVVLPAGVELLDKDLKPKVKVEIGLLEGTKEVLASVAVAQVEEELWVESVSPASIKVALRGQPGALASVTGEDVRLVVSAARKEAGRFTVVPSVESVRTPDGVRAVSVEQKEISITLREQ